MMQANTSGYRAVSSHTHNTLRCNT